MSDCSSCHAESSLVNKHLLVWRIPPPLRNSPTPPQKRKWIMFESARACRDGASPTSQGSGRHRLSALNIYDQTPRRIELAPVQETHILRRKLQPRSSKLWYIPEPVTFIRNFPLPLTQDNDSHKELEAALPRCLTAPLVTRNPLWQINTFWFEGFPLPWETRPLHPKKEKNPPDLTCSLPSSPRSKPSIASPYQKIPKRILNSHSLNTYSQISITLPSTPKLVPQKNTNWFPSQRRNRPNFSLPCPRSITLLIA